MKILAIETSCDETGVAVVEGEKISDGFSFRVLRAALLSQAKLHAPYGGVYPNLAKREHQKNLPILFEQIFKATPPRSKESPLDLDIDAIAVTAGPGLEPALWQGIEFAKKVAQEWHKPLIPTNHMEGHLISSLVRHTNILENVGMSGELRGVQMPVLALLISGGHTEFVLMQEWFTYEVIGETLDDAVGEAFDKVARMLGLHYPGGPEISKLAQSVRLREEPSGKGPRVSSLADNLPVGKARPDHLPEGSSFRLPRPMINTDNCDVSFSGLKTAALYALREYSKATPSRAKESPLIQEEKAMFAREFEDAVADVFVAKTRKALMQTGAQTFVIGGGVAANTYLRDTLQKLVADEFPGVEVRLPELSITGDNAIMIAEVALARRLFGLDDSADSDLRAVGNLSISSQK